jgi:hypothetical protein
MALPVQHVIIIFFIEFGKWRGMGAANLPEERDRCHKKN